ncbi:MAG: D-arabinono-1,4-lactone oxidase [Thermomicrobiales bacterium]
MRRACSARPRARRASPSASTRPWTSPTNPLFSNAEQIFLAHGGRPHWGKLHYLDAEAITRLYPELPAFRAIRAELDPAGGFTNDYLARLGLAADTSSPAR